MNIFTADYEEKGLIKYLLKYFSSKGYCASLLYRISHFFYKKNRVIAHAIYNHSLRVTGCDIHEAAKIGEKFFMPHPVGVVIGAAVQIGTNCSIMSNVTIGAIDNFRGGGQLQ